MSRNRTVAYINKIRNIKPPNGYRFDIENYLYNPDLRNEYPSFVKMIEETDTIERFRRIYYFKYRDGAGEYFREEYTREKDGGEWQVVKNVVTKSLEQSNRFNIKKLLSYCD